MAKRALILSGGSMRGAFLVGAMKAIDRLLDRNYFDTILGTSVGVFEQAFFASGQMYFMENTWREYVCDNQLINFTNPLRGKAILDLDYLVELFQSEKSRLDLDALRSSPLRLFVFVTKYKTLDPRLIDLKNGSIFDIMRATSALPVLYPKKVFINNERYVDSWRAPIYKFNKLLLENLKEYDEVLVVTSRRRKDGSLNGIKNLIKPSKAFLLGPLDTNRGRIIKTIELGEKDTEKFILEHL